MGNTKDLVSGEVDQMRFPSQCSVSTDSSSLEDIMMTCGRRTACEGHCVELICSVCSEALQVTQSDHSPSVERALRV